MMVRVGIAGGAGYTAGELLRVLMGHREVEVIWVQSTSHEGHRVDAVHADLTGDTSLVFSRVPDFNSLDVLFLCMGHGKSAEFMNQYPVPGSVRIIDLGNDFRLASSANGFVYGLPEAYKERIKMATRVANPGCFATAIQLALLPLAAAGQLAEIHVHAITGSTGAGQALSPTTHFSWRNNNVSIYKAFEHQHLDEINQTLKELMPSFDKPLNFVPMRGDFTRGIMASVYLDCPEPLDTIKNLYREFYTNSPFTIVSDKDVDLKQVVNTNKCLLNLAKYGSKLHVTAVIDNLGKGASSQAVQNMNLMMGLPEREGLYLKPSAF